MATSKTINGDCLEELKKLDDNSIDLLCTDPPYGYGFMGKHWEAEFSLTNRENMAFRMLLGRTSLVEGGLIVDPARSFTQGEELAAKKPTASKESQL